jgi:hypothetical protein
MASCNPVRFKASLPGSLPARLAGKAFRKAPRIFSDRDEEPKKALELIRSYVLGLDLGLPHMRVYVDGGIDAQALWLKGRIGSRIALSKVIKRSAGPDCTGVCIDEPFSAQISSVKALFRTLGAAVLACELAGLPCSKVHLSKLKILGTGKGILAMKELSV